MLKKYFLILGPIMFYLQCFSQENDSAWVSIGNLNLLANTREANLGNVIAGGKATHKFKIKNTDNRPLVIWHVTTSCGCTSPSWTKKPVKNGSEAIVKVKYKPDETGAFHKSVFVYTNFSNKPIKFTIKGNVVASKANAQITKRNTNFNSSIPKTN